MWLLFKKFCRDLGESKGQFISVLAVVIIGVMFYTGLQSALESLSGAGFKYFKEYRIADLWCTVYRAPEGIVKRIGEIQGVKMVTGRVTQDVRISIKDQDAIVRLISLPDKKRNIVNDISLKSGSYFSNDTGNQCIVSEDFLIANHLKLGQIIEPIVNGDRVKLKIVGTAKSPEYVYEIRDMSEMIPNPKSFGIVYVKESNLKNILDYKGSVNDISILLNQERDIKDVKDDVEKVLKQYGLMGIVEKKDQISYSTFSTDVESLKSTSAFFPMLFFIAAAVIIYITMTRMIENQRIQMGTFKALGYTNLEIMLHYQTYPLMVGILGSIAGSLIGVFIVGKSMLDMMNMVYKIPYERVTLHLGLVLPAAFMALAFCIAAGYNACKKELNLVPAQAMRPKPPATGRKILIENISIIWKKINFSWKIILRNLFRYKKRSAMASVGIIFSIALLLVALGSMDSMDSFMNRQFNEIQKFDIKISFSKILNADELQYIKNIEHIESIEPILESGMEVSSGWRKKDIGLVALPGNSKLYGILDEEDKNVKIPDDGILLPKKLIDTLGVKVGDTVFLRSFYPGKNDDRDKKKVMIMGTVSQITGQSAICSTDYLNYLIKEGVVTNAAHIKLADAKYESEVIGKLKDIMEIKTIQSKAEIIVNTNKMMESTSSVYVFMILGAGILAFAVIYNITNINIFERRREIATLAVLGFTDGELKSLIFNENFFIGIFGSIVGIPLGRFLIYAMFAAQENENIQFSPIINLSSYIYAVLLIGVFILMANFLLSKKIKSINMVESLKSSE